MISFNDYRLLRWDTLVLILAIWNCVYIPFEISFEPPINLTIEVLNDFIDLLFYLDIFISFRTTYMTTQGEEIMDSALIARKYIWHGTLVLDLLSVIPFNAIIPVIIKPSKL